MSDLFLLAAFPYVAVVVGVGGLVYRFLRARHTVTARSSQLLEAGALRWGSTLWHHAILCILLAHLGAALFPGAWAALLGPPSRRLVLEVTGLALGVLATLGVAILLVRRTGLRSSTSRADWLVLALLLVQAATGVWIAWSLRWGAAWYLHTAAPWLASLARLSPSVDGMAAMPALVKVHAVNAFLLLALAPLTRLSHAAVVPLAYLWRPPQLVLWRRPPAREEAP